MLAYFKRNFFITQISDPPKPLIWQCIFQFFNNFATIFSLRVGDIEHGNLHRSQPGWQSAGTFLDQNSDEALQTADDGTVQHDRPMAGTILAYIFGIQPLGHEKIDLNGAALPLSTDGIFERVLDFGAIKRALARGDFKFATRRPQAFHQGMFGLVPTLIRADALVRAGGYLVDDVFEAKVGIDFLQQRRVIDTLLQNLIFGAKDVAIVLRKAAHPHDAVQAARRFIAMALAELAIAQRQIAIALDALFEDQDVAGTVHRLQGVFSFLRLRREHVLPIFVPMAGLLPQRLVEDLWPFNLLVAVVAVYLAHVLLHALPQGPALGVPKHQTRRMVINVKQIKFAPEFAVIALLGFFEHRQVLL